MATKIRDMDGVSRGGDLFMVDPVKVTPIPGHNPRAHFDEEKLEALKTFIRENGVRDIPPITVRVRGEGEFDLLMGERRWRAAMSLIAEGTSILLPARIERFAGKDELDLLALAIAENNGEPLLPLEEARAYQRLYDRGRDIDFISTATGRKPAYVKGRLDLLIHKEVTKAVEGGMGVTDAKKVIKRIEATDENSQEAVKHIQETKTDGRKTRGQRPEVPCRAAFAKLIEKYGEAAVKDAYLFLLEPVEIAPGLDAQPVEYLAEVFDAV